MSSRAVRLGQFLGASPILAMPLIVALCYPAPRDSNAADIMEVTSDPAMVIARMLSDLDPQGAGRAEIGDGETITINACHALETDLCGREVIVYHSSLWNQWRLITADLGAISPHLRSSCDVAVAKMEP